MNGGEYPQDNDERKVYRPNFYAVIPANVRYNSKLPAYARLIFGEIVALCNKDGRCWAGNKYFSDIYQLDERTVQRSFRALEKENVIQTEVIGMARTIRITQEGAAGMPGGDKIAPPKRSKGAAELPGGGRQNCHHNIKQPLILNPKAVEAPEAVTPTAPVESKSTEPKGKPAHVQVADQMVEAFEQRYSSKLTLNTGHFIVLANAVKKLDPDDIVKAWSKYLGDKFWRAKGNPVGPFLREIPAWIASGGSIDAPKKAADYGF
jgi:hypothetical protein